MISEFKGRDVVNVALRTRINDSALLERRWICEDDGANDLQPGYRMFQRQNEVASPQLFQYASDHAALMRFIWAAKVSWLSALVRQKFSKSVHRSDYFYRNCPGLASPINMAGDT